MKKIFDQIIEERLYQINKWGTDKDLQVSTPMDWVGYITHHATRWFTGGFRPYDRKTLEAFRTEMIKVAATAAAAVEATDAILAGTVKRPDILAEEQPVLENAE
jgi:hypothetical protein